MVKKFQIKKQALFGLVFSEIPTYQEITNGTPKLSLTFQLSSGFKSTKTLSVVIKGIKWNTLENMIFQWKTVFETYVATNPL